MLHRVKAPNLGESVTRAIVVEWHVSPGETVSAGDRLITVETDKVDTEIPSPVDGTLTAWLVGVGDEIMPGDALCELEAR